MRTFLANGYRNVDAAADAEKLFRCLSFIDRLPDFIAYKERSMDSLNLASDGRVADVACGMGLDLHRLRRRVPKGQVVGFDISHGCVAAARNLADSDAAIKLIQADARSLPCGDAAFDAVRIDRSLQHMIDPRAVISEMARMTKSGGFISASEPDWSSFHIGSSLGTEIEIVLDEWRAGFANPQMGVLLSDILSECDVALSHDFVQPIVLRSWPDADTVFDISETVRRCVNKRSLDERQGTAVLDDLIHHHQQGTFVTRLRIHTVTGQKPHSSNR